MGQPRIGKTFRAAADRIVRQESNAPAVITRLLGSPQLSGRDVWTDDDIWDVRLESFAMLSGLDALMVLPSTGPGRRRAHNLALDTADEPQIQAAVADAVARGATTQVRVPVALSDGRSAAAVIVAPAIAGETVAGVLVGARVGRSFGTADAVGASAIGTLVALDLRQASATERETRDRRDALILYELARHAVFAPTGRESFQNVVAMLGDRLQHDVVHLWVLRAGGSLELRAALPPGGVPLEIARPLDHATLREALELQRVMRVADGKPRFWVPGGARQLLIAPLIHGDRTVGLLVCGRRREPYDPADEELADVIGSFLAGTVARLRASASSRPDYEPAVTLAARSDSSA